MAVIRPGPISPFKKPIKKVLAILTEFTKDKNKKEQTAKSHLHFLLNFGQGSNPQNCSNGFRGAKAADRDALVDILMRISTLGEGVSPNNGN